MGGILPRARELMQREYSDSKEAVKEIWTFTRTHTWKRTLRIVFARRYWGWWALLAVVIALSVILSAYHNQIVAAIAPYKAKVKHAPAGWLLPIVVLIVVSFPPLFGHELIILVVGLVYGLSIGFLIACAGTFLGEIACFYFRYYLTERAKLVEKKSVYYACLARLMRDGGCWTSICVRFSAVPGHVTTAIQSTIGLSIWVYSVAAVVSLPKQFALVYLGHVFGGTAISLEEWQRTHAEGVPLKEYYSGKSSEAQRHRVSLIVFSATVFATLVVGWHVYLRARRLQPVILQEMADAEKKLEDEKAFDEEADGAVVKNMRHHSTRREDDSLAGSQVALLSAQRSFSLDGGSRSRSDTVSSIMSGQSALRSPSLPNLVSPSDL